MLNICGGSGGNDGPAASAGFAVDMDDSREPGVSFAYQVILPSLFSLSSSLSTSSVSLGGCDMVRGTMGEDQSNRVAEILRLDRDHGSDWLLTFHDADS